MILFVKSDTLGARIVHKFQNFISLLLLLSISLFLFHTHTHMHTRTCTHPTTKHKKYTRSYTQIYKSNNSLPISGYHILIYSHTFLYKSLTLLHCLSFFTNTHTLSISQTQSFTHTLFFLLEKQFKSHLRESKIRFSGPSETILFRFVCPEKNNFGRADDRRNIIRFKFREKISLQVKIFKLDLISVKLFHLFTKNYKMLRENE